MNAQWYSIQLNRKAIAGELKNVRKGLKQLISNMQSYAERKDVSDNIKLLIPQQYVAKIIGVGKILIVC
jgi:hypothetical protein